VTVVVTIATRFAIVAACDSAVKEEFEAGGVSYGTGRKSFVVPGAGVVTTWGARDGNDVGAALSKLPKLSSISDVARRVSDYLEHEYDPRTRGLGDVGFHIAGFENGQPRVFHAFWNVPNGGSLPSGQYALQDLPFPGGFFALYNGRHDLAASVFQSLTSELQRGQSPRIGIATAPGMVALAHLILRFASELSADVGPPFLAHVLSSDNRITSTRLPDWQPVLEESSRKLALFLQSIDKLRL
jgi:hypothetical protein